MKQKFCKKLLLIVTAVMMLCSALPLQTFTQVSAASDYEIVTLPAPDGYGQKSRTQISKNGKIAGGLWYIIAHNGDIAYCLEPGKPINSFKYKEGTIYLSDNQETLLGQIFLYAYAKKPSNLYSYSEYLPQYIATQLLVWEVIAGQRDAQFNRINNGYTPVKDVLNNFKNAEVCKQVKNFYESYEKNIKTGSKEVSFAYKKDSLAKENALKCGSDGTYTFTDKNGQLNNFDVTVKDGSVVSKSATQLKVKAEANKTALITMKQNNVNASGERCGMLVLTNGSNNQTITKLQADPRDYYAAVKGVENGSLWIKKSSPDDNKVEGITFHITGNGIDGDYTTGKDGYIRIPGLKPGTYKVSEKTSSIYTNVRDKTVIVEAGKTAYVLFVNTLKKGHLVVTKYTEDKAEANFTFGLYSTTSDGKVYDTFDDKITTYIQGSGYGKASWTELPFWTEDGKELIYVLTEKNAPDRYVTLGEFEGSLLSSADDNGLMIHLDVENKLKRSSVLIVKKDSESGDNIPLPGTEFQILDSNGNKVILTDDDGNEIDTFVTDESGQILLPEPLVYGTYQLIETKAPEGYVLDKTPIDFAITEDGATVQVEKQNTVQKGTISISKIGDVFSSVESEENSSAESEKNKKIYSPVFEENYLKGAKFDIIAAEDIYTPDGNLKVEKDTVVDTITTGSDGTATSKKLYLGTYRVAEIEAPEGFVLSENVYDVNINVNGVTIEITIRNKPIKGNVLIAKYDSGNPPQILNGAVFAVYRDVNGDKKFTGGTDELLGNMTESSAGIHEYKDLLYGDYLTREIKAPEGYTIDRNYYAFSIKKDGETVKVGNNADGNFYNKDIKGNIEGVKVGESDEPLSGAVIGLFSDGESDFTAENALAAVTTEKDGKFIFKDIVYGKYIVAEIQSPTGYILTEETFPVSISKNNEVITVKISNEKIRGNIEGIKIGESDEPLAGAVIGLFADGESDFSADKAVKSVTTDENGKFAFEDIEYGKYIVAEIQSPEGYVLTSETFPVSIEENGQVITVKIHNEKIRGTIEGVKVGKSDEPLAGAVIGLFANGESEFTAENALASVTTEKDGRFIFKDIEYGKYIVAEIESPEGYILTEKTFPVSVSTDNEVITVKISNEKIKGNIEGIKVGESDEPLSGAVIGLFADGESDLTNRNALGTVTTDENGKFVFENVEYGKYIIAEIQPPEGYILTNQIYPVEISQNTQISITIVNVKIKGIVEIEKYDSLTDEKLSGAEFTVFTDTNGNGKFDEGEQYGVLEEVETGLYRLENIPYGSYFLKETKSPDGYYIDDNYYNFKIENNGEVVKITNNDLSDKFVNQKITTTTTTTVTTTTTFTSGTVPYVTYNNPSPLTGSKKIPAAVFITGLTAFGGMLLFKHRKQNKK